MPDVRLRAVIAYNGKICGYQQMHPTLMQQGSHFRTQSDTAVIPALYRQKGLDFIHGLHGEFAFILLTRKAIVQAVPPGPPEQFFAKLDNLLWREFHNSLVALYMTVEEIFLDGVCPEEIAHSMDPPISGQQGRWIPSGF